MARRAVEHVANDNGDTAEADEVMRAALRHFAVHGLGAARAAREHAEEAFFRGDRNAYDWWLKITRALDRRLAAEADGRMRITELS
ncbi:hypothetical protein [Erythrobacter ani]|nr:hypothetical protein [Erythrobacter ani]